MDGCRRPTHVKTRRRTDRTNAPNDEAAVPEVEGKCGDEDNGEGRGAEATFCSGGMRGGAHMAAIAAGDTAKVAFTREDSRALATIVSSQKSV